MRSARKLVSCALTELLRSSKAQNPQLERILGSHGASSSLPSGNVTFTPAFRSQSSASPAVQAVLTRAPSSPSPAEKAAKIEVSTEAKVVFESCWKRFENKVQLNTIVVPREIVFLNGAPGSGKGANTPFILKHRGLNRAIAISGLLDNNPEVKRRKDAGELIPDHMVGDVLLHCIFDPVPENDGIGLVIDGFPRTALQADFMKLLHDKLSELHRVYKNSPEAPRFPRPIFKVVVLYVDEEESVRRQLGRAREVAAHNLRVRDAGVGSLMEARTTDLDEKKARLRYAIFKHHYTTLLRLMQHFPFTLIDAMGTLRDCELQIAKELRYQSSLDLDEETYQMIAHIPLAMEVVRRSRQQLVARLDWYAARNTDLFRRVISVIDDDIIPTVKRCSLAGHAEFITANNMFHESPVSVDMVADVLSDRGFSVSYRPDVKTVPARVDLKTGEIQNRTEFMHRFRIQFDSERIRDHAQRAQVPEGESSALELIDKLRPGGSGSFGFVPPQYDAEGRVAHTPRQRPARPSAAAAGSDDMHYGYDENDGYSH